MMPMATTEQSAATSIRVEQDVNPGELVDDRSIVVAVTSRRKLGKQLTIARCVVNDVRGELSGGLARDEIIDVVAGGASAKAFAAGPAQRPRHRLGAVVIEAKPSRSGRRVARVLRYDGAVAPVVVEPQETWQNPKADRAEVFAAWLDEKFGRERLHTIVDVAGGKGAVAAALLRRGASRKATVIDPVGLDRNHAGEAKQASVDDAFSDAVQLLKEPFAYPPSQASKALLAEATCVVAMHPDEATEPAVCAAASLGLPFAVVPCCIFASKFPHRRQFWKCDPAQAKRGVKDWDTFCEYLAERATALGSCDVKTETLALVGRNKVVYSLGAASTPYVTWPGDCVAHVASYLPLDDLCLGSMRCVDKEWRFHSDRSLRLRLDEVKDEIARSDGRLDVAPAPSDRSWTTRPNFDGNNAARRCANAAELRRALDEEGTCHGAQKWRRACRLAAAVHGVVLGPAYVSYPLRPDERRRHPCLFVERAQLYVELCDDEAQAAMSAMMRTMGRGSMRDFKAAQDKALLALMRVFGAEDGPTDA